MSKLQFNICGVVIFMILLISMVPAPEARGGHIVLVPPFQNLSPTKAMISYEVATSSDHDNPKRSFRVDRYSEAPRGILEDILVGIRGVSVVERQRVDAILLESEFGHFSGLVDTQQAVQMGKLLGANSIVMGSILDINTDTSNFSGYGIKTKHTQVKSSVRIRLIDIGSGRVTFSKIVKGEVTYSSSSFGGTNNSDVAFAVIEAALEELRGMLDLQDALSGESNIDNSSGVTVKFSPIPDNCDIDIGGSYMGGSPIEIRLAADKPIAVRISKAGYQSWEKTIVPKEGLIVRPELLLIGRE